MPRLLAILAVVLVAHAALAADIQPLPFKTSDKMPDALTLLSPSQVKLSGFLGTRVDINAKARLLQVDEDELLAGFRRRPGSQDWIGEHAGKFLHAATLAWAYNGDAQLKAKIDRVAAELIKCQDADGYLGTYLPQRRWTSWDVWVHKYDLLGLLTYYQYTDNQPAFDACRKIGDLLASTFGPGKRDIIRSGEHVGMAATSVLEPVVLLYRLTADQKYLNFARYIISAYDQPNGPKIIKTLLTVKRVDQTANGKAYEMMSNLVGLCEYARVTGDKDCLTAAINAWEDIVANHLYITGSASQSEHFHAPHDLPNGTKSNVAETCATVTWIQLNAQLLRLTGDARYAEELERTFYNHLAAAQRPDGAQWCYFTPLTGTKPYGNSVNCCLSSGPRGMALVPQMACFKYQGNGSEGIAVGLFEFKSATLELGGRSVEIRAELAGDPTGKDLYSADMAFSATYAFQMSSPARFAFKLRSPRWAQKLKLQVNGEEYSVASAGWIEVPPRQWKNEDRIKVSCIVTPRLIVGDHTNAGSLALAWGPFVLAYDETQNSRLPAPSSLALAENPAQGPLHLNWTHDPPGVNGVLCLVAHVRTAPDAQPVPALFVPFADAGETGGRYQVWMSTTNHPLTLLMLGKESRSRQGNANGSVNDGNPETFVVTYDGRPQNEDWFAVTLDKPATIGRFVFAHGRSFHDGGWFDATAGRPRIQVQKEKNGAWETVGELKAYPATTATDSKGLKDGQEFELKLDAPVSAIAVRVIGKPACGDGPQQAFSSCGELSAYTK